MGQSGSVPIAAPPALNGDNAPFELTINKVTLTDALLETPLLSLRRDASGRLVYDVPLPVFALAPSDTADVLPAVGAADQQFILQLCPVSNALLVQLSVDHRPPPGSRIGLAFVLGGSQEIEQEINGSAQVSRTRLRPHIYNADTVSLTVRRNG